MPDVLVDHETEIDVLVEQVTDVLVEQSEPTEVIVTESEQGPPGPRGPVGPTGGFALTRTAGATTSALLAVWEDEDGAVWVLDSTDDTHIDSLLGVTLTAADAGQPVNVQRSSAITDSAWSWTPGSRVYLGANGTLTQAPPVGGFDVLIGVAVSATRLILNLQDPIELE